MASQRSSANPILKTLKSPLKLKSTKLSKSVGRKRNDTLRRKKVTITMLLKMQRKGVFRSRKLTAATTIKKWPK